MSYPITEIRTGLFVSWHDRSKRRRCGMIGVPRGERRTGIVFKAQLDRFRHLLASNVGHHLQAEVDAGGDAACRDQIPISDDALFLVGRADQR